MIKRMIIRVSSLPLSVKMLVMTLVLSLLPLFIASYFVQRTANHLMLESKRVDLTAHAEEIALSLSREIDIHLAQATSVADNEVIRQYAENPTAVGASERTTAVLDTFFSMHAEVESIFLVDTVSGEVVCSTKGNVGRYFGNRPFVKEAVAGKRYASAPSSEGGRDVSYYSAPVKDSDNRTIMTAVLLVDAESLWEPLRGESKHRGQGSVAILTDEYGVRIGHGSDESLVFKAWAPLPEETAAALLAEEHYGEDITEIAATDYPEIMDVVMSTGATDTFVHQLEISDEAYESGLSKVQGKDWTVMDAIPHSSFLGSLASLRKGMAVIIILTALIVTVITLVAGLYVSRPVRLLVSSTQKMADGDFTTPFPDIHDREMGSLAKEFDKMRNKVAETYGELEQGYLDMAKALVASLEARDHYTAGHTERVGQYSVALARRLGLDDEETAKIKKAADLHDIGKVGVSDSVLLKPSRLTAEEFAEIKRHPGKSGEIVHYLGFLRDVVPTVEGHHERYDGNGYPLGLRGENIPRGARILAVADAFDAMTSNRAYRDAMDHDVAISTLKEGAGSQWDPEIIEAFLEMIEDERGEG